MNNLPLGTSDYDKRAPWNQTQIGTCKMCLLGFDASEWHSDICDKCWDDDLFDKLQIPVSNSYYTEW